MIEKRKTSENVGYYHSVKYSSIQRLNSINKMHGVKRVITFCILIVILPAILIIIPLYLRHSIFADVIYQVSESDIIEIRKGISSIFCSKHSLHMNTSFNAFQLNTKPEISKNRKHIRLKKSMILPDDTLEYWGFYLLKGAKVELKVCSRYKGSNLLIVKDDRNLNTCNLLEHNKNKFGAHYAKGYEMIKVKYETVAEIILSNENLKNYDNLKITSNTKNLSIIENEEYNNAGEDLTDLNETDFQNLFKENINSIQNKTDNNNNIILNKYNKHKLPKTDINRNVINHKNHVPSENIRHRRHHHDIKEQRRNHLIKTQQLKRIKRYDTYDRKIVHGGNANMNITSESDSASSFENSLIQCYDNKVLLQKKFDPSVQCLKLKYLENGTHMITDHEIIEDGYYYYIFYSDNDLVRNYIHAVFDIYKPTFQYSPETINITDFNSNNSNINYYNNGNSIIGCVNQLNCTFSLKFFSGDFVIVEVPTKDGIEYDDANDISYLISTCHPRNSVYVIFPISVLFLILTCAFL